MSWPRPVRIVAVGSPCGDDRVGWDVVRALRTAGGLGAELESHVLEGGQRLLDLLDGGGSLLLVDAVDAGAEPGTIHCFEWPDTRLEALRPGSTHDMNPAEALRLAEALGLLPLRVVVFGIQMETLAPRAGLSAPVAAAVPLLVRRIQVELAGAGDRQAVASQSIGGDH